MTSSIPHSLQREIKAQLENFTGKSITLESFSYSSGGCINNTGIIDTNEGPFFLKWNSKDRFPNMFEMEARGLDLLIDVSNKLKIPKPIQYGDDGTHIFLLMENVSPGARKHDYWQILGSGLAQMHRRTSEMHGLEYPNYIGSLSQINEQNTNWLDFFIENRLEKPFIWAYDKGLLSSDLSRAKDSLIQELPSICPEETPASLMHGDLWSGNLMTGPEGQPCLIDPAVYYGFREMEIAFTQLFGRYSQDFYNSYNETWPLEAGFEERIDIWNLYPLLVHVNLFGAGYTGSVRQILRPYI